MGIRCGHARLHGDEFPARKAKAGRRVAPGALLAGAGGHAAESALDQTAQAFA